ncbi:MAG: hypothetical protein DYG96_06325 [Chlorobi bacterium CHB2]|nr:hypothetical protein [Chlorobi bacterium CHB2]
MRYHRTSRLHDVALSLHCYRRELKGIFILSVLLAALGSSYSDLYAAGIGDTVIRVYDHKGVDSPNRVFSRTVLFPSMSKQCSKVMLTVTLDCPRGGCDPWDRGASIWITNPSDTTLYHYYGDYFADTNKKEIARFITPYGKNISYQFDVTDFRPLLADSARVMIFVTTYTGKGYGYLLTMDFEFTAGVPSIEPYRVVKLWGGSPEYGNPANPIENFLKPLVLTADPQMEFARARVIITGHGQGNTDNAGEFARKWHQVKVDETVRYGRYLWRDDCGRSSAGEQYGTWTGARAGFCPGEKVDVWDVDLTPFITAGKNYTIDYDVEPYENRCRPGVAPCPCPNCEYDGLGHNKPIFHIESYVIYYRVPQKNPDFSFADKAFTVAIAGAQGRTLVIKPNLAEQTDIQVVLLNGGGEEIFRQLRHRVSIAPFEVSLATTPGSYLLSITGGGKAWQKKLKIQ